MAFTLSCVYVKPQASHAVLEVKVAYRWALDKRLDFLCWPSFCIGYRCRRGKAGPPVAAVFRGNDGKPGRLKPELFHEAQLTRHAAVEGMLGCWQLVHMDILGGVTLQRLDRLGLVLRIDNLDPQQQSAIVEMLLQALGVFGFHQQPQIGTDHSATAACYGRGDQGQRPRAP